MNSDHKKKNNAISGEARNRRVLHDIGNFMGKQGHGNGINVYKPEVIVIE